MFPGSLQLGVQAQNESRGMQCLAKHRTLFLLPSLNPSSFPQRCRQARLCVSSFQCLLFRILNYHLSLAILFAKQDSQELAPAAKCAGTAEIPVVLKLCIQTPFLF